MNSQIIGLISGFFSLVLGLWVFSYLLGDNPFYRFAMHLLIGVSAGVSCVYVIRSVIYPQLIETWQSASIPYGWFLLIFPVLGSSLLLTRLQNRWIELANPVLAFIVGVGAAVSVVGVLRGTLIPQMQAAMQPLWQPSGDWAASVAYTLQRIILLIGTLCTLLAFSYVMGWGQKNSDSPENTRRWVGLAWLAVPTRIGLIMVWLLLAALYAGALASGMAFFNERLFFMYDYFTQLFQFFSR
ncbi:MAG TPA: hypothetical protein PK299_05080 [Anaerolineales bacterium]|nr:hypothetical protein [Anaerolineales bacterium]